MNFLTSKTFLGLVTVFVSSALGLLRSLGLHIPDTVDPAINQVLINGVGLYLLISGHQEALYTTPPVTKAEPEPEYTKAAPVVTTGSTQVYANTAEVAAVAEPVAPPPDRAA